MVLRNKGNLVSGSPAQTEGSAGRRRGRWRGAEDQVAQGAGPLRRPRCCSRTMLTHPYLSRARANPGADLHVPMPGKAGKAATRGYVGLSDAQLHHSRQLPKSSAKFPRPQIRRSDSRQWTHSSDHLLTQAIISSRHSAHRRSNAEILPPNSTTTSRSLGAGSDSIVLLIYIRRRRRGWKPPSTSRSRTSIEKDRKAHALAQPPSAHPGGRKSSFLAPRLGKSDIASFPSCSPSRKHITFVSAECGRAVDMECGAPLTWPRTGF
jgi:hypothetical protein